MTTIPDIPYEEARARRGQCIHHARSVAQADLFEIDWNGRPALLKDFNARPWIVRRFWSRHVCAREARALRRLDSVDGIPHLFATAGPCAFIMERLDGDRLPRRHEAPPPAHFWASARAILDSLHEAGISHGDLRRKNILMGRDGRAFFIDFATAARLRQGGLDAWFSRRMFYYVRRIDRVTFARIKASYSPDALDETERAWLADDPWHLRFGRWFKRHVYRLRKPGVIRHRLFFLWTWILSRLGLREKARRYR